MVKDRATLTVAGLEEVVYGLLNGAIRDDFEQPITEISRSHYHFTLNNQVRCDT